nr:glycerol dehydratase reactivase beta/small subunit family protein [Sedimentibacter sp.]
MIMQQSVSIKPVINIYYDSRISKSDFISLLHGVEEEGIPYELVSENETDAVNLSYAACCSSKLGVGLGVSKDEIALHYEKLDKSSPLYKINISSKKNIVRALGANAARLVKRIPFKDIQE